VILELSDQDNVALEEISKILERHPDLKLIEMVVEPTLIFNHLIIDTGKRKVSQVLNENARKPLSIGYLAFSLCSDILAALSVF